MNDPITRPCPACQARAGMPCTVPTDNARRPVKWFHLAREDEFGREDDDE